MSMDELREPDFTREEIKEVIEESRKLRQAYFIGIDLSDADLWRADLTAARLSKANLTGANLGGASLRKANLFRAILRDANLIGADLTDAVLSSADLRGAKLRGSALLARYNGAHLSDPTLTHADFESAWYDNDTTFPEGFDPEEAGMMLIEEVD